MGGVPRDTCIEESNREGARGQGDQSPGDRCREGGAEPPDRAGERAPPAGAPEYLPPAEEGGGRETGGSPRALLRARDRGAYPGDVRAFFLYFFRGKQETRPGPTGSFLYSPSPVPSGRNFFLIFLSLSGSALV